MLKKLDRILLSDTIDKGNFKALQQLVRPNLDLPNGQPVVDNSITKYYNTSKWNSKSVNILLLLQRNTNEILDVSNQNVDDGFNINYFFLLLNKS